MKLFSAFNLLLAASRPTSITATTTTTTFPAPLSHDIVTEPVDIDPDAGEKYLQSTLDNEEDHYTDVTEPVSVVAHCNGVHFEDLTVAESAYAAKALQVAFNAVHEKIGHGDAYMHHTSFVTGKKSKKQLKNEDTEEDNDALTYHYHYPYGPGSKYWPSSFGIWLGGYGCRLCDGYDDDALSRRTIMSAELSSGNEVAMWQAEFVRNLVAGSYEAFHSTKNCALSMKIDPEAKVKQIPPATNNLDYVTEPVSISVDCRGIHFESLTVAEAAYTAKALEDAYNAAAQAEMEAGDSFMNHTTYVTGKKKKVGNVRAGVGRHHESSTAVYYASYGCNICDSDHHSGSSSLPNENLWQAEFVKNLLESPHITALHSVQSCVLTMKIRSVVGVKGTFNKDGGDEMTVVDTGTVAFD